MDDVLNISDKDETELTYGAHTSGTLKNNDTLNEPEIVWNVPPGVNKSLLEFATEEIISHQLTAFGATPITWTEVDVPSWLSVSSTGLLEGTAPVTDTTGSIKVTATNSFGSDTNVEIPYKVSELPAVELEFDGVSGTPKARTATYGDGVLSAEIATVKDSSTAVVVSYGSSNEAVATVNNSGVVTVVGAGTTVITATSDAPTGYRVGTTTYTLTVNKATLTIQDATHTKVYDGGNAATGVSVTIAAAGFKNSENQSTLGTLTVSAEYQSKNVGALLDVTGVTYTGTQNYTITPNTGLTAQSGGITAKELTVNVSVPTSRVYNGTNQINYILSTTPLSGVVGSEDVGVTAPVLYGTMTNADVGNGKAVTYPTFSLDGTATSNYSIAQPSSGSINITAADYTVSIDTTQDYKMTTGLASITVGVNGTTKGSGVDSAAVNGTLEWFSDSARTVPAVDGDLNAVPAEATKTLYWKFTATDTNYINIAKTGQTVFTALAGDPRTLTFGTPDAVGKDYGDGPFTNTATVSAGVGIIEYSSGNTSVATVDPGTGQVTIVGAGTAVITASIPADPGYHLSATNTYTLTVAKAALTIDGAVHTKAYDGNTTASGITNLTLNGYKYSDNLAALGTLTVTAAYTAEDAGTTTLNVSAVTYSGAQNYTITVPSGNLTVAGITKKNITIIGATITPQAYTGTTTLPTAAVTAVTFDGDVTQTPLTLGVTYDVTAAAFTGSVDVGSNRPTTITVALDGAAVTNYNLTNTIFTGATASITKATGAAINGLNAAAIIKTDVSITVNAPPVALASATGQAIEYAIVAGNSTIAPTSGWQDTGVFTGLTAGSTHVVFVRSKDAANYAAGTAAYLEVTTKKIPTAADLNFTIPADHVYTGSAQGFTVTPKTGVGAVTVEFSGTDYSPDDGPTNAGTYAVTVAVAEGADFLGTTVDIPLGNYIIAKRDIEITDVTFDTKNYDGKKTVTVTDVDFEDDASGSVSLVLDTDYIVTNAEITGTDYTVGWQPTTVTVVLIGDAAKNYRLTNSPFTDEEVDVEQADAYGVDKTVLVKEGLANEYEFDLSTLLPNIPGLTNVTYEIDNITGDSIFGAKTATGIVDELILDVLASASTGDTADIVVKIESDNYDISDATITVEVIAGDPAEITGVSVTSRDYDGTAITIDAAVLIDSITLSEETATFDYIWDGFDYAGNPYSGDGIDDGPVNAGDYTLQVVATAAGYVAEDLEFDFSILPATLTVTADNQTAKVGDDPDDLELTVTTNGFFEGDDWEDEPIAECLAPVDGNGLFDTAGVYPITFFDGGDLSDNYVSIYIPGTLTVNAFSIGCDVIAGPGLTINGNELSMSVENSVTSLNLSGIEVSEDATWLLYDDIAMITPIAKTVTLAEGTNIFYIKVTAEDTHFTKIYNLTVARAPTYLVTVNANGGTGSSGGGNYAEDATVTINAGTRDGWTFDGWTVTTGGVTLANAASATTTFTMPANAVTVTASWIEDDDEYLVTVNANGGTGSSGGGNYAADATVTINAGTRAGWTFAGWTVTLGGVTLANAASATTTFTMPASAVTVTANWTEDSPYVDDSGSGGGGGGGTPPSGDTIKVGDVNVSYTQEDGDVTLKLSEGDIEKLISNAKDGEVTFDISGIKDATAAILTADAAQAFSDAEVAVSIILSGAEITLDPDALALLAETADDGSHVITVEAYIVPMKDLNGAQAAQVKGYETVVSVDVFLDGKKIDVPMTVTMPYKLKANEDPNGVRVWYMNEYGKLTDQKGVYDKDAGTITFSITHQSQFVVGYDEAVAAWNGKWNDVEDSEYFNAIAFIAWYKTDINESLFAGTSSDTFSPGETMTRGDFMMVLHKLAGRPEWMGERSFTDVEEGAYYYDAVLWGVNNGIIAGRGGGLFAPEDALTREEMAVILNKYAKALNLDVEALRDLPQVLTYSDWADKDGHITSLAEAGMLTSGGYDLTKSTTREEIAQMYRDFVWFIIKE